MKPRLLLAALIGVCGGVGWGSAGVAAAEEVAAQARADDGAWLSFAPPPAAPAGICLIDSGVDLTPDTTPVVLDRFALDGGDPGDVSPLEHGTLMAMEAAAPANGWGMIGAAPNAVRIVSIRAESANDALTFSAYKQAIVECQALAERRPDLRLRVISMSIGFQTAPSAEQLAELRDAAEAARGAGLDVFAAAGDEGSSAVSYPAAVAPIVSVGAYDSARLPCAFSNGGTEVAVLAPGCDLTEANPATGSPIDEYAGTSQATAICAAVVAALRAYLPQLGPEEAESLLSATARSDGGALDVASLFRAAGLAYLVQTGTQNEPASSSVETPVVAVARPRVAELPAPRFTLRRRGAQWRIRLLNLPREARAVVRVDGRGRRGRRRVRLVTSTTTLQLRISSPLKITVVYLQGGGAATSTSRTVHVR